MEHALLTTAAEAQPVWPPAIHVEDQLYTGFASRQDQTLAHRIAANVRPISSFSTSLLCRTLECASTRGGAPMSNTPEALPPEVLAAP